MSPSHQEEQEEERRRKRRHFGNDKTTSKARAAREAGKCGGDELLIDCTGALLGEMAGNFYL